MAMQIIALTPDFAVSPQLLADDFAFVSGQGFKTLINNRPDGEGGDAQPISRALEEAAHAAGLHYVYLPVVSGAITTEQVQALQKVLASAPRPMLAFCRSGARSAQLFGLTQQLG
ncbi:MAG: TIGR01244 family sulfur transferase [Acidovorax sp.]|uniref:TIGR01244 family sulfur transferase n=1 Tax=Acidovorax sp. TaxID=1872122 RepID=UPI00261A07B4|nr:TIGR01244 family sulfur transferase [Acidovorax sp.]MDH4419507.1 TIGR01244 family sulfur transferase [Acidovorax sp.]